ncbi:MAG: hypothetical protein KGL39_19755 [Patescibacteria group bacterium]|nr:hypothetical protein [Patescibacteria group bacterium]
MPHKWMVDVLGSVARASMEDMNKVMNDQNFREFMEKEGELASNVQRFIMEHGYEATDKGGGIDSWHIGVPFDTLEKACVYLGLLESNYFNQVAVGFLKFRLMSWSKDAWKS